jgi:hypothetical protein
MPVELHYEPQNICVIRFSGVVKQAEFKSNQNALAAEIDTGAQPRVLGILENFNGWEKSEDWGDFDFMLTHGDEIAKIAIVGEPRWEAEALAFCDGALFRECIRKVRATTGSVHRIRIRGCGIRICRFPHGDLAGISRAASRRHPFSVQISAR